MLKITNKLEDKEILVTKGAYENLYKGLGYKIVKDKETTEPKKKEVIPEPVVSEPTIKKSESDDLFEQIKAKKETHKKK